MRKRSKNGFSPLEVIDKYGADVARMLVHFLAGYEDNCQWTFKGIEGIVNFLDRVWKLQDMVKDGDVSKEHEVELNVLIKKASSDYENLKLNTCIAACMTFVKKVKEDGYITREELRQFLIVLNPLAPHITSEMYERVFGKDILDETFPEYEEAKTVKSQINLPVQVNGKMKGTVAIDISQDKAIIEATCREFAKLEAEQIKKVIYVPGRIINFII